VTVVLYNMFDTYVEIGEAKIVSSDVAKGENFDDSSKTIFLIMCFFLPILVFFFFFFFFLWEFGPG
jgi:hypothetical protein